MNHFKGTWTLTKLALRTDRIKLPLWLTILGFSAFYLPTVYREIYENEEQLIQALMIFAQSPAARIFSLPTGISFGQYVIAEIFLTFSVIVSLVSILAVIRHTRGNEETGRTEIIGSTSVGRYSVLTSALAVAIGFNILVALLISSGFIFNELPVSGSIITGLAIGLIGIVFAGIAAITAQLYETTRASNGMASIGLAVAVIMGSIGSVLGKVQENGVEVVPFWTIWISPTGWGQVMKSFGEENWWPLSLFLVFSFILISIAFILNSRRDVGLSILKMKPGKAKASFWMLSPIGLAWKMQKGLFIGWIIGISLMGLLYGALSEEMINLIEENPQFAQMMMMDDGSMQNIQDLFVSSIIGLTAIIIMAYTIQVLLKIRSDEISGITESVLSTSVSRWNWTLSQFSIAIGGTVLLLVALSVSTAISAGMAIEDIGSLLLPYIKASLSYLSAIFLVAGIIVSIIALLPRWSVFLSWTIMSIAIFFGPILAPMFNLSETWQKISPFTHVPNVLLPSVETGPIFFMFLLGLGFLTLSLVAMRKRDIQSS